MQITAPKQSTRRRELIAYLFIGVLVILGFDFYQGGISYDAYEDYVSPENEALAPTDAAVETANEAALAERSLSLRSSSSSAATAAITTTRSDFVALGNKAGTDKVAGHRTLPSCLKDVKNCAYAEAENDSCRVFGHFYDSIYERWLAPYTSGNNPVQFLEIGYFQGKGFETFTEFLSDNKGAELHSMEIACLPEGPREEGKWPWGNFATKHRWYQNLRDKDRLHCGDAADYDFLENVWTTKMKRSDAPPLKVVIDDASHEHKHMAASLFFWFPRIEPGGIMVVEDIQPTSAANKFRTHIVPQVMKDLHWCGGQKTHGKDDSRCFPTIQPLLQGIHCELHICVFVRNNKPAREPDKADSLTPSNAFDKIPNCLFGPQT